MATTTTTTTAGDSSTMKSSATLSSGDLVSRLLAATPPYLYNVPLTSHSFFFSEMLRSFVQAKSEADTSAAAAVAAAAAAAITPAAIAKRRKRSWRDTRERPLELTTKDKNIINQNSHAHSHHHHHHHHHTHHHPVNQQEKYFHQELMSNGFKITESLNEATKNFQITNFEHKLNGFSNELLKPADENSPDFANNSRHFFDDSSRLFGNEKIMQKNNDEKTFDIRSKIGQEVNFLMEQSDKMDLSGRNFTSGLVSGTKLEDITQTASKGFELSRVMTTTIANTTTTTATIAAVPAVTNTTSTTTTTATATTTTTTITSTTNNNNNNNNNIPLNNDFIPSPMWYPPYPMAQSYPGIDPLHFFIDLRVSGHIWDRKLSERPLPFKGKHCSAFSVPQSKEYNNHPLNLTRDEATTSRCTDENYRGTHFILKNLTKTYKDIGRTSKIVTKCETDGNQRDSESVGCETSTKGEIHGSSSPSSHEYQEEETTGGKDLRALIGLELVVDYVKEPKEEPITR